MLEGYVCLVGAGPGDAGLITRRGLAYLKEADVVFYDNFIPCQLLLSVKKGCELVDVGKKGGSPSITQAEINQMLIREAKKGKFVVRLKGGDPFLLGRGGEEASAMAEAGVPYLVVPGISSSLAAPAYSGIPVTDRRVTTEVTICSGQRAERYGKRPSTRVVLMALANLEAVVRELRDQGYPGNTPACLISRGTTPFQRVLRADLDSIVARAVTEKPLPPALLVIGEVVAFHERLDWRQYLPLADKRILWTRPLEKDDAGIPERLELLGAEVLVFPTIETRPLPVEAELFSRIHRFSWIVFTSATGVDLFFQNLLRAGLDGRALYRSRLAVVGRLTGKALQQWGLRPDLIAGGNSQDLLKALQEEINPGDQVLLCQAAQARAILAEGLAGLGIDCKKMVLYEVVAPSYSAALVKKIFADPFDLIVFTSPLAAANFWRITAQAGVSPGETRYACLGRETAAQLEKLGVKPWLVSRRTDCKLLVAEIVRRMGGARCVSANQIAPAAPDA